MEFYFLHEYQVVLEMIVLILHNPVRLIHRHSAVCCSCYAQASQETNLFHKKKVVFNLHLCQTLRCKSKVFPLDA